MMDIYVLALQHPESLQYLQKDDYVVQDITALKELRLKSHVRLELTGLEMEEKQQMTA